MKGEKKENIKLPGLGKLTSLPRYGKITPLPRYGRITRKNGSWGKNRD